MSTSHPLPPKKEVALALLERSSVHVHLDPRAEGVAVPAWFKKQPQLVLQIGLNMAVPIPDLRLDDEGMTCTLSFSRQPFFCVVPWHCVFAMVGDDGRGMVWPDDVPPEIASASRQQQQPQVQEAPPPVKRPAAKRPAIDERPAPAQAQAQVAEDKPKGRKTRSKKPRIATSAEGAAEPEIRPVLVAVPAPAEKRGRARDESEKKRPERPVEKPEPRAHRPQRPAAGPPKPKRELPPYLRVVK